MLGSACSVAHPGRSGSVQFGQAAQSAEHARLSMLGARASLAPDWLRSGHGPQPLGCRAVLPLPARALLASDWLIMHVAHIKRAGMRPGAHLCVTHRASEQAPSKPSKPSKFRPSARLGSVACMLGSACSVAHSGRSGSAQFSRAADWAAWARFDYSPGHH